MEQDKKIKLYITLLKEYNETTNIYSKNAYDKLDFHIKDCEILASIIKNEKKTILDIGSGSGLPAIPIAIINSKNTVIAVESKSRKTKFLREVKEKLNLNNLTIHNHDINQLLREMDLTCDTITAKAFAPFNKIDNIIKPLKKSSPKLILPISEKQKKEHITNKTNVKFLEIEEKHYYLIKQY